MRTSLTCICTIATIFLRTGEILLRMGKTAGIIIIGDEILTGKVQDYNAFFMAKELWAHGIQLRRISVIPDLVEDIAEEVGNFAPMFDYVFTSGGIGPTHDDVTIEGISRAFNVNTVIDHTLKEVLERKLGALSSEQIKMAEVPDGAELVGEDTLSFPLIKFRNVFILPGIPELLRKKFHAIEKIFNEPHIKLKKVYLQDSESNIAPVLKHILHRFNDVKIGSYPVMNISDYSVIVTLESLNDTSLDGALEALLGNLPVEKVVKVEG
jgi:molybdenum cofactor synthesis domain-containing protein